jgi:hypothetical protein
MSDYESPLLPAWAAQRLLDWPGYDVAAPGSQDETTGRFLVESPDG